MYRTTSNPTRGFPATHLISALVIGASAALLVATCDDGPSALDTHDDHPVASLVVEPLELDLQVGDAITLTATATCEHGEILDGRISWSSDGESVAWVTRSGKVIAAAFGSTTIRATAGAKSVDVAVSVAPEGTVVGSAGALLVSPDQVFSIEFPPGALTKPTDIVLERLLDEGFLDPLYVAGTGYVVRPESLQLEEDARVRIRYEDVNLPWGSVAERLRLYVEVEPQERWKELAENQIDLEEHEVEAMTAHLGTFALVPAHFAVITNHGGEVTSADGESTVWFHAGAVPYEIDMRISIHRVPDYRYADEPNFVPGTAYEVVFEEFDFSERAHIRLGYDPLNLPPGTDPEVLRVHYWDGDQDRWIQAPQNQVHAAEQEVEAEIEHPAIFALFASEN